MSRATRTAGSKASREAGHRKLRKYTLRSSWVGDELYWLARVPYGSLNRFDTWAEGAAWLRYKHGQRVAKARRESEQHA